MCGASVGYICSQSSIQECLQPLDKYQLGVTHNEANSKKAFPFAQFSREEIVDICKYVNIHNFMHYIFNNSVSVTYTLKSLQQIHIYGACRS